MRARYSAGMAVVLSAVLLGAAMASPHSSWRGSGSGTPSWVTAGGDFDCGARRAA